MNNFHDVRFPLPVSFGATGGPERMTEIVTLGSGREERNQRWAMSRRRYDAGTGLRNRHDLQTVVAFFEERRGRLHGFRFRDPLDHSSARANKPVAADDQLLGAGDGSTRSFPLIKRYGDEFLPYDRPIVLPVVDSAKNIQPLVAVAGVPRVFGSDYLVEDGRIVFFDPPEVGESVTAGFEFDVPVRFDTDTLEINLSRFDAGLIPSVPLVEIFP